MTVSVLRALLRNKAWEKFLILKLNTSKSRLKDCQDSCLSKKESYNHILSKLKKSQLI